MLTEQQIRGALRDAIDEWWVVFAEVRSIETDLDAVIEKHAHAIAKRLSEGVVWEGQLDKGHLTYNLQARQYRTDMSREVYATIELPTDHGLEPKLVGAKIIVVEGAKDE